ncbi:MAG: hypothetical protein RR552_03155 [Oscillospiraceae bacterium]
MNYFLNEDAIETIFHASSTKCYILVGAVAEIKTEVMNFIATYLKDNMIYFDCILSPNNFDNIVSIIIKEKSLIFVDGNYFNCFSSKYPLLSQNIINLDEIINKDGLNLQKEKIMSLADKKSLFLGRAERFKIGSRKVKENNAENILPYVDKAKILNYCSRFLIRKKLSITDKKGELTKRSISSITPWGIHTLYGSVAIYNEVIVIDDDEGLISALLLNGLKTAFLECGIDVIALYCGLTGKIEHLAIPSLSTCFFTKNSNHPYPFKSKSIISAKRFVDANGVLKTKQKMKINKKIYEEFLDEAVFSMFEAFEIDSEISKIYYNCVSGEKLQKAKFDMLDLL